MGETTTKEKTQKKSFFKGLKAEFKKIIWPDKETLGKQTAATLIISILLCFVIAILDMVIKYGVEFLVK